MVAAHAPVVAAVAVRHKTVRRSRIETHGKATVAPAVSGPRTEDGVTAREVAAEQEGNAAQIHVLEDDAGHRAPFHF